jgi:hypothetical protein
MRSGLCKVAYGGRGKVVGQHIRDQCLINRALAAENALFNLAGDYCLARRGCG